MLRRALPLGALLAVASAAPNPIPQGGFFSSLFSDIFDPTGSGGLPNPTDVLTSSGGGSFPTTTGGGDDPTPTVDPSVIPSSVISSNVPGPTASDNPFIVYEPPNNSGSPCAGVIAAAKEWLNDQSNPNPAVVEAELAYNCLLTVPFVRTAAADTMEAINRLIVFETTLAWLKDPPSSYGGNTVDILGTLGDITNNLNYDSYFEFEDALVKLVSSANSGHFNFQSALGQAVAFLRPFELSLTSVSSNGEAPQVYLFNDVASGSGSPSAITQINGKDTAQFIEDDGQYASFQDPDARYNSYFHDPQDAGASLQVVGDFCFPPVYPGPTTELTFANGTTRTYTNQALINGTAWAQLSSAADVFARFVSSEYSTGSRKRSPISHEKTHPWTRGIGGSNAMNMKKREAPEGFPQPFATPDFVDDTLFFSGYFQRYGGSDDGLAILSSPTFSAAESSDQRKFQNFITTFLNACRERGTQKIIVDMSSNGGGTAVLSFDMFKQFFPEADISFRYRFRASEALNLMGQINTVNTQDDLASSFDAVDYLNDDGENFGSWSDLYGPQQVANDDYTNLFQFNLSDSAAYLGGDSLPLTDYGRPAPNSPFDAADVVILTNGMCSSACNNFVELMSTSANVKIVTVGGRPNDATMVGVGGVQGGVVLLDAQVGQEAKNVYALDNGENSAELERVLPLIIPNAAILRVNSMNAYRAGADTPIQFASKQADCRLYYTSDMVTDVAEVWRAVADVAWSGDNGGIDYSRCVGGQGSGDPPSGTEGTGDNSDSGSGSGDGNGNSASSWRSVGSAALVAWVAAVVTLTM